MLNRVRHWKLMFMLVGSVQPCSLTRVNLFLSTVLILRIGLASDFFLDMGEKELPGDHVYTPRVDS